MREIVVAETPYIIPYRVRGDAVEILRVFHAARRAQRKIETEFRKPARKTGERAPALARQ